MKRPYLTTRTCADLLGLSSEFIRGEINDGRLVACVRIPRPSGRTVYRVSVDDFRAYCEVYAPSVIPLLPAA